MKLFIVLVLAVILIGPTVAKMFSKEVPAQKRGVLYRLARRFGMMRVLVGVVVVFVAVPAALWGLLAR